LPELSEKHLRRQVENLDLLVDQMREEFKLYEHRRLSVEGQATAVTAASLAIAALLIANENDLASSGEPSRFGSRPPSWD
jgi:hypothetical protein